MIATNDTNNDNNDNSKPVGALTAMRSGRRRHPAARRTAEAV